MIRRTVLAAALLAFLLAGPAMPQGTTGGATNVNPSPGSLWTYLGATYGAGWVPPLSTAICKGADTVGLFGDGVQDNLAVWNALMASFGTNGICLSLRAGATYYFSGAPATVHLGPQQPFVLYGNRAKLLFHNSNGLSFQYTATTGYGLGGSRLLIADTDFVTDATGFTGIAVNGGPVQYTQLVAASYLVRNFYYGLNQDGSTGTGGYWGIARAFIDASEIFVDGEEVVGQVPHFVGIGLDIQGTNASSTPSVANVANEQDWWLNIGVNVHGYFQGLNVGRGSNYVGLEHGIVCNAPNGTQEFQCDVHDSSFNVTVDAVLITNWTDNTIQGNDIAGGVFGGTPTGTPPLISIQGTTSNSIVSGNHIEAYSYGNGNLNSCVALGDIYATNIIVNSNYMACNGNDILGFGSPQGVTAVGNRRDGALSDNSIRGLAPPYFIAELSGIQVSSDNVTDGDIRWNGHIGPHQPIGALPTVTCGAGAVLTGGGDSAGTIAMSTASSSCALSFARAHTEYSTCIVTSQTTPPPHFQYASTLAGFTATWPGDPNQTLTLNFICFGS